MFNSPRDRSVINTLARQMSLGKSKYILEAYTDAVENKPYGYLMFDYTQTTSEKFRVSNLYLILSF